MAVVLAGAPYVQPSGVVLIVLAGHSIAVVLARPHRYGHYGYYVLILRRYAICIWLAGHT